MNKKVLCIEPHYLPSIAYFRKLCQHDKVLLEINHRYQKQSYQNRCYIGTSLGMQKVVIPVRHKKAQLYKEVEVSDISEWQHNHYRAFAVAYGRTPYFEMIWDLLQPIYNRQHRYLISYNIALLKVCMKLLDLTCTFTLTDTYQASFPPSVLDARYTLDPKEEERNFTIGYIPRFPVAEPSKVSILDLLVMEGKGSRSLLEASLFDN